MGASHMKPRFRGRRQRQPREQPEPTARDMMRADSLAQLLVEELAKSEEPFWVCETGLIEATIRLAMQAKPCTRSEAYEFVIGLLLLLRKVHEEQGS